MKILFSDHDEKLWRPPKWITNYSSVQRSPLRFVGGFVIFYFTFLPVIGPFVSSFLP